MAIGGNPKLNATLKFKGLKTMTFKSMRYTNLSKKITSFTIIKQAPNNTQTRWERRLEEHPDRNDVNERSACNDHSTHSLCFRERDPNRNTRETGIRRVTVRRSEEKCMEADVHQHGTSQAAREDSWLPWKQGRLPLEEMVLKKPLNINPVGTCRAPFYISSFILSSRWR